MARHSDDGRKRAGSRRIPLGQGLAGAAACLLVVALFVPWMSGVGPGSTGPTVDERVHYTLDLWKRVVDTRAVEDGEETWRHSTTYWHDAVMPGVGPQFVRAAQALAVVAALGSVSFAVLGPRLRRRRGRVVALFLSVVSLAAPVMYVLGVARMGPIADRVGPSWGMYLTLAGSMLLLASLPVGLRARGARTAAGRSVAD